MKYGDSLYRCKQLKRAALGRMCTLLKKLQGALGYLEQVRQHLSRLPSINPNMRTLLITGFPNVGKSSFINSVTRADVEVQPYAFTTKSLFVGHTDHNYLRWQVIDTPGILDHPLEDRNTIEMQAITALAHLQACVLYFMDLSGMCGYSIEAQVSLFKNIKPLFANKPLVIAINKVDIMGLKDLKPSDRKLVDAMIKEAGPSCRVVELSVLTDIGVATLKESACELLLTSRLEVKQSRKTFETIQNRIRVAMPDGGEAAPEIFIPESVIRKREQLAKAENDEEDDEVMEEDEEPAAMEDDDEDGPVTFDMDMSKLMGGKQPCRYIGEDDENAWPFGEVSEQDPITEVYKGKNISDWIDPEIEAKLLQLEMEEEGRLQEEAVAEATADKPFQLDVEAKQAAKWIRDTNKLKRLESVMRRTRTSDNRPVNAVVQKRNEQAMDRTGRKRTRSQADVEEEMDDSGPQTRGRSTSRAPKRARARSVSAMADRQGMASGIMAERVDRLGKMKQGERNRDARKGEGDRHEYDMMPKHLFSGKRQGFESDRR
jgi:nucleolar GTP-binding protein